MLDVDVVEVVELVDVVEVVEVVDVVDVVDDVDVEVAFVTSTVGQDTFTLGTVTLEIAERFDAKGPPKLSRRLELFMILSATHTSYMPTSYRTRRLELLPTCVTSRMLMSIRRTVKS